MNSMDQTPRRGEATSPATSADELLLTAYREATPHEKRAAANRLFENYYERVGRWCYRFTGDRESAADLAQEVFLKAHRSLDSFRGTSQFGTWLYSIARNEAINRSKKPQAMESEEALIALPALDPSPEHVASEKSTARRLHQFLQTTLEETERTVFTLHYGEDLPLDAITRLLQLENSSGAKAYIVSAKRKLARAVEKMFHRREQW
jgi:RNA polymerase sigma-70 factor (ECF subfamily)